MQIDGAIVKEQGITFAIVIVKESAMQTQHQCEETRQAYKTAIADFRGIPLILASQDSRGVFSYQGRPDIIDFLANIDSTLIPWATYTYS